MRARDRGGRVLALPSQMPGLVQQYGVTRAQAERELWTIDRTGRPFAGAAAVNRILSELGKPWRYLARAYQFATVRWAEDVAYRWVANNRSRLWILEHHPECEWPDVTCE